MESVIGVNAVRVSRLDAQGNPDFGNAMGGFVVCGGISTFEHDFETEAGSSIFQRDAAGNACVNRRRNDDVKFATFTLTMCRDDPRLTEILLHGGADVLVDQSGYPIGRGIKSASGCGESGEVQGGVCIELWSELYDCDAPSDPPYQRVVLPFCQLVPAGFTREDGVSLPVYNGFSQVNPNIGNGPFDDFDVIDGDLGQYCYFDFAEDDLPTCASPLDYVLLPSVSV